jgi:hypothetical protein
MIKEMSMKPEGKKVTRRGARRKKGTSVKIGKGWEPRRYRQVVTDI